MAKKESFNATLRSFLIWFLTFYALFWGYQTFIASPPTEEEKAALTDLELIVPQSKFVLGRPFTVYLKNNQTVAWDYTQPCADDRRLRIERVLNQGQGLALEYTQADCKVDVTASERITIPAGSHQAFTFGSLNARLFTEAGSYRVVLPDSLVNEANLKTEIQTSFTYKEAGFFRKTFRSVVSQPLFNLLAFLVDKLPHHSLGWAIVIMTLLVRMILIVPNQKAMKSQRKLQKLQPEIQSLKKKHGDNQQAMAMATMALYKKNKINPMSSCLPILLQMPFLLGIYFVVRDGLRPHFEHLLYGFQSGLDLSRVDNAFFGLDLSIPNVLVLPVIVGIAQFIAMRLAIPSTPKTEEKAVTKKGKGKQNEPDMAAQMQQMQKMMVWVMPIMIAVFTATFPAGVGIYWLTSTVFGIGQQKLVNWQLDRPKVKRKSN